MIDPDRFLIDDGNHNNGIIVEWLVRIDVLRKKKIPALVIIYPSSLFLFFVHLSLYNMYVLSAPRDYLLKGRREREREREREKCDRKNASFRIAVLPFHASVTSRMNLFPNFRTRGRE